MTDKIKNQGPGYRLGHWLGRFSGRYLRSEAAVMGWLRGAGLPAVLAGALKWSVRLAFVGAFLYLAFWVAALMFGLLALSSIRREDPGSVGEIVDFDLEELCPDPHAPKYIHDPRFDRDF
ncbi:DUF3742 family protein [Pseudomonas gingeri]|uniref:DUF3742 family protein n=1 Tax=Pseudomonas gingeri TaxID=117681 RepID=A0A7Y7XH26_9PSED|nr:DUF3742 family protein [Pseudomonas gingeri]NWB99505.1 DUF3742 family protein [Pseudomonas gingeri]